MGAAGSDGLDRLDEKKEDLRVAHAATEQARAVGLVHAELAELRLYLATIVSLLIYKKVMTADEFEKISRAIDASDGVADGQFHGEIGVDGKIRRGDRADGSQAIRELAAIVRGQQP